MMRVVALILAGILSACSLFFSVSNVLVKHFGEVLKRHIRFLYQGLHSDFLNHGNAEFSGSKHHILGELLFNVNGHDGLLCNKVVGQDNS